MRWPAFRFKIRHLMIGVAVAALGLFHLRVLWGRADEIVYCQWSEDWRPWNLGHAVRVQLDADRSRAYNLTKEDVMDGLKPGRMVVDPREPPPPPGVVFGFRIYNDLVPYENIVLKANSDGVIVRLKDVAKVKIDW